MAPLSFPFFRPFDRPVSMGKPQMNWGRLFLYGSFHSLTVCLYDIRYDYVKGIFRFSAAILILAFRSSFRAQRAISGMLI